MKNSKGCKANETDNTIGECSSHWRNGDGGGCSVNNKLKAEDANLREQVEHMNSTSDMVIATGDRCHTIDYKTPNGEHLVTTCRNADGQTYVLADIKNGTVK